MAPRRCWLLLWLLLAAALVARATWRPPHRGVLIDHLEFGRRLLHGEELYAPWRSDPDAPERPLHAPYPPSFGLLTAPFAVFRDLLGLRAARMAWALLQIAAIVALAWSLRRLPTGRAPPGDRAHRWLLLGALLLGSRFVLRDLHGGGGNLINVGLCTLSFALAGRGRPAASGWLLGLSLATKPTHVWLLPLLAVYGHRRAAAHAVVAAGACVLLSLLLLRGDPGAWLRWCSGTWAFATQADAFAVPAYGFPEFEWMNQSLRCATARWLGEVPAEHAAGVALGVVPGLGLPVAAAAGITRALSLLLLAWLGAAAWRARAGGPARTTVFAAVLTLSLLLSPLSWKAHHVALLPALYALLHHAASARSRATGLLLAAFVPACALGGDLLGDDVDELMNSLYFVTAFDLLLLAAAVALARGCPPRGPDAGDAAA
jgi:hypothetical protein